MQYERKHDNLCDRIVEMNGTRLKNGARKFVAFCLRHMFLSGLVLGTLVLLVLPSCDKTEELQGFLMSDGIVKGGGFLIGLEKNGQTNVLFVTCRHVLEDRMLLTGRNFLDGPSDGNAIFLNMRGAGFRYRKISNIEPSRWRLSGSRAEDVAWLELTESECRSFAGEGRIPVVAWIGEAKGGFRAVNEIQMVYRLGVKPGEEVTTIKLMSATDMLFPLSGVLPFPYFNLALANAYESTGIVEQLGFSTDVGSSDGSRICKRMHRIACSAHKNNSGSPVLYKGHVIGLIVAANGPESAFQCLDPIFKHYGLSR